MNTLTIKNHLSIAVLLGLSIVAQSSVAASLPGSLLSPSGSVDYYRVTCSTSATNGVTDHLNVSIIDLAPVAAPVLSVQVTKGIFAINTSDPSETESPSVAGPVGTPWAMVGGVKSIKSGNGVYDVRVTKTAAGVENYRLIYNCVNNLNKATVMSISTVQNY